MELTISLPRINEHEDDLRVLWYDTFRDRFYWAQERRDPWHVCALDPEELEYLCPASGSERTIRIEAIMPIADAAEAAAIWRDPTVDVVAAMGRRCIRCFGPLAEGRIRRRLDGANVSVAAPDRDGRWVVVDTEYYPADYGTWEDVLEHIFIA